jgi:hypothetical protein
VKIVVRYILLYLYFAYIGARKIRFSFDIVRPSSSFLKDYSWEIHSTAGLASMADCQELLLFFLYIFQCTGNVEYIHNKDEEAACIPSNATRRDGILRRIPCSYQHNIIDVVY